MKRFLRRLRLLAVLVLTAVPTATACGAFQHKGAVSLKINRHPEAPKDAAVIIDEQYIGPLEYVAKRGVRLPVGEHRITIEKNGYFPYDKLVVADRNPVVLEVELVPIPD